MRYLTLQFSVVAVVLITVTINVTAEIDIPDAGLRAHIETALGKQAGDPITTAEMGTLTRLEAENANVSDLTGLEFATHLKHLGLRDNSVSNLSPLAGLTNLTSLLLWGNSVSDLSALAGLTNLIYLELGNNSVSDLSALAGLTNLTGLVLWGNSVSDLSALAGLTNLIYLELGNNLIVDLSALVGLTDLTSLLLGDNSIADLSPPASNPGLRSGDTIYVEGNPLSYPSIYTHIPTLQSRGVTVEFDNRIPHTLSKILGTTTESNNVLVVEVRDSKGKPFAGVPVTFTVTSGGGTLSSRSAPTNANGQAESQLTPGDNEESTVTASVEGISQRVTFNVVSTPPETNLIAIAGHITNADGTPAEAGLDVTVTIGNNTGTAVSEPEGAHTIYVVTLGIRATSGDTVEVQVVRQMTGESTTRMVQLSSEQIIAQRATIDIQFAIKEYLLSVPSGISLIHVPLKVTAVDGGARTIESVGDLYDALGGAADVSLLITYNPETQRWMSYLGDRDKGKPEDKTLTDDLGIIASMKNEVSVRLIGIPLGTGGSSSITLHPGINLVGVPLMDARITRVSDLLALEGIAGNVTVIIALDGGRYKVVARAGDEGDVEIRGGSSFILTAREAATVDITGYGWVNAPGIAAVPPIALTGIQSEVATPILAVTGSIVPPGLVGGASLPRLSQVTVKNLSTGKRDTVTVGEHGYNYQLTFVDIGSRGVAQIGDILEITAQSSDTSVGIQPARHVVTAEDVTRSVIQLDALLTYEIPTKTELLHNYPNPFNPETWIPYRLASDANVTLTIYDQHGGVVRKLDVGHRGAAVYQTREKAIYWDGRNNVGERVSSGIYFYQLQADNVSFLRKMVILK